MENTFGNLSDRDAEMIANAIDSGQDVIIPSKHTPPYEMARFGALCKLGLLHDEQDGKSISMNSDENQDKC